MWGIKQVMQPFYSKSNNQKEDMNIIGSKKFTIWNRGIHRQSQFQYHSENPLVYMN